MTERGCGTRESPLFEDPSCPKTAGRARAGGCRLSVRLTNPPGALRMRRGLPSLLGRPTPPPLALRAAAAARGGIAPGARPGTLGAALAGPLLIRGCGVPGLSACYADRLVHRVIYQLLT